MAIVFQFFDMFFRKFKVLLLTLRKITDNYSILVTCVVCKLFDLLQSKSGQSF